MAVDSFRKDEKTTTVSRKNTLVRLFSYLLNYTGAVVGVLFIMAVTIAISVINPLLIERAIDVYISKKDVSGLIKLAVFGASINLVFVLLVKLRMYVMAVVSNKILLDIRRELYEHIQTLSFQFFDSRPTGKILARIIGDVNSLKKVLADSVTTLIPDFVTICAVVVIMFVKDARLAAAALSSLPLMIAGIWYVKKRSQKKWQIFRKKGSNLNAFVHEDLSGIRVVKSLTAEKETKDTFSDLVNQHEKSFQEAVVFADMFGPIIDFCWGLGTMVLFYVGIAVLGTNQVSVGILVAFGTYISMFWSPVLNVSNFYNQLITNLAGAERIFEILDTKPDILDNEDVIELPEVEGAITFDKVSFSYDEGTSAETKVLREVSFSVKPGETIALVGPTGAGKSTIVNLISRFYDIQKGHIYVDGYDLQEISIASLRRQMGVMTQDNFLFSGTVEDNIRYGRLDATRDEIVDAAKAVNAHHFIMQMEHGYDTLLKERGAGISIGQRQLIAFARTMLSMPKVLILDEATSSIDTKTELLVQQGIETLLKGRTSFVIAHRLSTIQKADRIFVIDKGGIVEEGSAKELLAMKGQYYNLYMAQFKDVS
ncbi:MAG: ABC transporter ATP-binding protein [Velocimicrobium sp.]